MIKGPIIYLALIVTAFIIVFILRVFTGQSRSKSIYTISEQLGFSFKLFDDGAVLEFLKAFPLYNRIHNRSVSNIMTKSVEDVEITIFDYEFSTFSKGRYGALVSHPSIQTTVLFKPKTFEFPVIEIHPKDNNPGISKEAFEYFNKQLIMSVESNKHGMIVYDETIKHSPEDFECIILERLKFVELIKENPNLALNADG